MRYEDGGSIGLFMETQDVTNEIREIRREISHLWWLIFFGFVLVFFIGRAGSEGAREGELVTHWIACKEFAFPPGSQRVWHLAAVNTWHYWFDRFKVVGGELFQVSFSGQRVVASGTPDYALNDCTVYDRKNWACTDADGSLLTIQKGQHLRPQCALRDRVRDPRCLVDVDFFQQVMIAVRGMNYGDSLCENSSRACDACCGDLGASGEIPESPPRGTPTAVTGSKGKKDADWYWRNAPQAAHDFEIEWLRALLRAHALLRAQQKRQPIGTPTAAAGR